MTASYNIKINTKWSMNVSKIRTVCFQIYKLMQIFYFLFPIDYIDCSLFKMLLLMGLRGEPILRLFEPTQLRSKVTTALLRPDVSTTSSFFELERMTRPADKQQASRSRPRLALRIDADDELLIRGWHRPDKKCEHGAIFDCWQRTSSISFSLHQSPGRKVITFINHFFLMR